MPVEPARRESVARLYEERHLDPITHQPLSNAVVLQCGHSFSKSEQLKEWIEKKKTCPCCQKKVSTRTPTNYYANELYGENQKLAVEVDRLNARLQQLKDSSIKQAHNTVHMELTKNYQIEELRFEIRHLSNKVAELNLENFLVRDSKNLSDEENKQLRLKVTLLENELNQFKANFAILDQTNWEQQPSARSFTLIKQDIAQPTLSISATSSASRPTKLASQPTECPLTAVANCLKDLFCCERN